MAEPRTDTSNDSGDSDISTGVTPVAYTLNDYQDDASVTAIYPDAGQGSANALTYLFLKLNGEAGEVGEAYAKYLRGDYGLQEAKRRVRGEIGDVLWYIANICTELDVPLGAIARENYAKLISRKERGVITGSGSDR